MTNQKKLLSTAKKAQKFSYAPYSKAYIGAALITNKDKIYSGANVENASFGGTVCAERVAIFKAVSENKNMKIREILVINNFKKAWAPCGLCRQVMAEFCKPDTLVHMSNQFGETQTLHFKELFPNSFDAQDMTHQT